MFLNNLKQYPNSDTTEIVEIFDMLINIYYILIKTK